VLEISKREPKRDQSGESELTKGLNDPELTKGLKVEELTKGLEVEAVRHRMVEREVCIDISKIMWHERTRDRCGLTRIPELKLLLLWTA
jgi:hypothetical protein